LNGTRDARSRAMAKKRLPPQAGSRQSVQRQPNRNRYDADPYDPLNNPPSHGKPPLMRDDASNESPQKRPRRA
jgi:hypothetical protein